MDFWHQYRMLRIEGFEGGLPFGKPPLVIGHVVRLPEPVWRTLIETSIANGVPDLFRGWAWDRPLDSAAAGRIAHHLDAVVLAVGRTGALSIPANIADAELPDVSIVMGALPVVQRLLALAAELDRPVETWVD